MKISRALLAGIALVTAFAGGSVVTAYAGGSTPQPQNARPQIVTSPTAVDSSTEAKYTAIAPCRIIDTRLGGGAIVAGTSRAFFVAGTFGFAPQGGTSGGCGVPSAAVAIQATVVSVGAASPGYLKVWAYGSPVPTSSFLNYSNANAVTGGGAVPIDASGARHLQISANVRSTNVVVDVQGYYVGPMWAELSSGGTLIRGSRVATTSHLGTGEYEVDFDRNVSGCAYHATAYLVGATVGVEPRAGNANGVFVYFENSSGYADNAFYLTVTC